MTLFKSFNHLSSNFFFYTVGIIIHSTPYVDGCKDPEVIYVKAHYRLS